MHSGRIVEHAGRGDMFEVAVPKACQTARSIATGMPNKYCAWGVLKELASSSDFDRATRS
jgi:hypothetical protein